MPCPSSISRHFPDWPARPSNRPSRWPRPPALRRMATGWPQPARTGSSGFGRPTPAGRPGSSNCASPSPAWPRAPFGRKLRSPMSRGGSFSGIGSSPQGQPLKRQLREPIRILKCSADGWRLAACDGGIELWRLNSRTLRRMSSSLPDHPNGAAISGDGSHVVAWSQRQAVVWSPDQSPTPIWLAAKEGFHHAALAASGRLCALLDGRYRVRIWDLDDRRELASIESPGSAGARSP